MAVDKQRAPKHVVQKLQRLCKRWGGAFVLLADQATFIETFRDANNERYKSEAPFINWHGINWKDKIVYATHQDVTVGGAIHEMGHVFASKRCPKTAGGGDEWSWLGWEGALARHVGCYQRWSIENGNYGLESPNYLEWRHLSLSEQRSLMRNRIAAGVRSKRISKTRRPLAIR